MELVASWVVQISLLTTREDEELNVHDLRKCYLTVSFKQIVKRNLDFSFSVEKSEELSGVWDKSVGNFSNKQSSNSTIFEMNFVPIKDYVDSIVNFTN